MVLPSGIDELKKGVAIRGLSDQRFKLHAHVQPALFSQPVLSDRQLVRQIETFRRLFMGGLQAGQERFVIQAFTNELPTREDFFMSLLPKLWKHAEPLSMVFPCYERKKVQRSAARFQIDRPIRCFAKKNFSSLATFKE